MSKKTKINFNEMPPETFVANNGFVSQWCCTCKTRHILHFKIHKGDKSTGGAFIEINWFQDNMGTKLRKFYGQNTQQ